MYVLFSLKISHILQFTTISNLKNREMYLLEKLYEEIQEIDSSEIIKRRLMCPDWLFWWNICRLSYE